MNKQTAIFCVMLCGLVSLSAGAGVKPLPKPTGLGKSIKLIDTQKIGEKSAKHQSPSRASSDVIVLSEDFSNCTAGTEETPDANGIVGEINSSLTLTPGWQGGTFRQAGGVAFLDTYTFENNGEMTDVWFLDTPVLGLKSGQSIIEVTFRARTTKSSGDALIVINANASTEATLDYDFVNISSKWEKYTLYLSYGSIYSFLEFQGNSAPFYIDDIKISAIGALATPKVLPATDITSQGFTANWSAVEDATGYQLYPKAIRTSDGLTPRYLLNADFEGITEGTINDPVPPQYSVYSLDDIVPQAGWLVRLPYFAKGALGLSNKLMYSYGNSLLQSPTLNLSGNNGVVNCKMRYLAQDVDMFQVNMYQVLANGSVSLRATKLIYTYEDYNVWKDVEFTLGGGTNSCMIVVILPETTKGTVFFDELQFEQTLDEGARYVEPLSNITTPDTSAYVSTPDASEDDSFAYSVMAYRVVGGNYVYSETSNDIIVGNDSDEQPDSLSAPTITETSINGGQITVKWDAVENANAYRVDIFRRHYSNGLETIDVINENFDGIRVGTTDLDHPRAMTLDGYDRLDNYTKVPGWEVFQGYYVDGAVGILGYWNMLGVGCYMRSPNFDLSANGGVMNMTVTVGSDYYNQGATIYLAHENPETGGIVYDDIFPMDEMSKGFHDFATQFKGGRKDSFFVFFPYGYGVSYFDNIHVTQQVPEGLHDYKVTSRTTSALTTTLQVPDVVPSDEYYVTVTALWIDSNDLEKVASSSSKETPLEGLQNTAVYAGKVVDTEGNYIANAMVSLIPSTDSKQIYSATTNRWGLFRIENILIGEDMYTPSVSAQGYLSAIATGVKFDGVKMPEVEFKLRKASSDTESEIGTPSSFSAYGPAYLQYNNSESETIYPADAIKVPKGAKITSIAFDGYCDTEKDVTYRMELYLENTDDSLEPDSFTPRETSHMTLFDNGNRKIEVKGSKDSPEEIVAFTNKEGFLYTGGNLRVRFASKANKSNYVYFLVDGTRINHSMYRNWSSSVSNDWKLNTAGMPVMRVDYLPDSSGIETILPGSEDSMSVTGQKGAIHFSTKSSAIVKVHSIDGVCVATLSVPVGESTFSGFSEGLYIVDGHKVVVR